MKTKTKFMLATAATATAAAGYYGLCQAAYNRFVKRGAGTSLQTEPQSDDSEKQQRLQQYQAWYAGCSTDDLTLTSFDGLRLHAVQIANHPKQHRWAILVHGYGADSLAMLPRAMEFDRRGYNVLLPDCRGHGLSEGSYVGFGWHDRLDLIGWINKLTELDAQCEIVLYGLSMGAAAVMMACGEPLDSRCLCAIEDCGYTSVDQIAAFQLRKTYGPLTKPISLGLGTLIRSRCGYSVWEADCRTQLAKAQIPMMFIHGEEDDFVPFDMVFECYYACASEKELYTVSQAGHAQACRNPNYYSRLFRFIDQARKQRALLSQQRSQSR